MTPLDAGRERLYAIIFGVMAGLIVLAVILFSPGPPSPPPVDDWPVGEPRPETYRSDSIAIHQGYLDWQRMRGEDSIAWVVEPRDSLP